MKEYFDTCPWCDNPPDVIKNDAGFFKIKCSYSQLGKCKMNHIETKWYRTLEEARSAWNERCA